MSFINKCKAVFVHRPPAALFIPTFTHNKLSGSLTSASRQKAWTVWLATRQIGTLSAITPPPVRNNLLGCWNPVMSLCFCPSDMKSLFIRWRRSGVLLKSDDAYTFDWASRVNIFTESLFNFFSNLAHGFCRWPSAGSEPRTICWSPGRYFIPLCVVFQANERIVCFSLPDLSLNSKHLNFGFGLNRNETLEDVTLTSTFCPSILSIIFSCCGLS